LDSIERFIYNKLNADIMKRITLTLLVAITLLATSSCGVMSELLGYHFDHYDKVYIENYNEQMYILSSSFPEIYNLYCNGKIDISEMYHYKTKDGQPMIHIGYYRK
jgi:hypothetical protein